MNEYLQSVLQILGASGGAWLAIRVELRWLRADVQRIEKQHEDHTARLRKLELKSQE